MYGSTQTSSYTKEAIYIYKGVGYCFTNNLCLWDMAVEEIVFSSQMQSSMKIEIWTIEAPIVHGFYSSQKAGQLVVNQRPGADSRGEEMLVVIRFSKEDPIFYFL